MPGRLVLYVRYGAYLGIAGLLAPLPLFAGCGGTNNPSRTLGLNAGAAGRDGGTTGGGTGGSGVTDARPADAYTPLCGDLVTAADASPTKLGICTASDPQLCYKTCGPRNVGFKSETCMSGIYAEMSGCSFPSGDYSCYKIPATIDPSCPSTTPQSGQPCAVAECVLCNVGGNYLDSGGNPKTGYCVCPPPNEKGNQSWSCASSTAWPCPLGQGC